MREIKSAAELERAPVGTKVVSVRARERLVWTKNKRGTWGRRGTRQGFRSEQLAINNFNGWRVYTGRPYKTVLKALL